MQRCRNFATELGLVHTILGHIYLLNMRLLCSGIQQKLGVQHLDHPLYKMCAVLYISVFKLIKNTTVGP